MGGWGQRPFGRSPWGGAQPAGGTDTPPIVTNQDPDIGTEIQATDTISFDVIDDTGFNCIAIIASFADLPDIVEVVHDGDGFRGMYNTGSNTRVALGNGFRYTVLRKGGWPASPTLEFLVVDESGQVAQVLPA